MSDAQPLSGAPPATRPRSFAWAGYAAFVWALVFAAMSFYWAVGGDLGIETQAPGIREYAEAREPWFVALLWATGAAKVIGVLLALALVQPWGRIVSRRLLLIGGWAAGVGMTLYGALNLVVGIVVAVLSAADLTAGPEDASAFWWHLLLWDPWWLLGGILFLAATWRYQRGSQTQYASS